MVMVWDKRIVSYGPSKGGWGGGRRMVETSRTLASNTRLQP